MVLGTAEVCGQSGFVQQNGRSVHLSFPVPDGADEIILEIHSDRNQKVSKLTDVSPNNPKGFNPLMDPGKDMWFPVIDIELIDGLQAVAELDAVAQSGHYSWNSNFWPNYQRLQDELVFEDHLEHWENHLYGESETARLKKFFLRKTIPVEAFISTKKFQYEVKTLSSDWSGEIKAFANVNDELELVGVFQVAKKPTTNVVNQSAELKRENLISCLRQAVEFVLSCQNTNPLSPTYGGLFLFYDLDAKTFRRSDWIWTYGPAIKLLLDAAKIPELTSEFGYEKLMEAAKLIGEASLRFQLLDKTHPAYGLTLCRYDPKLFYAEGFTGYLSPVDSHFLAGYGWIPLYEATGDHRFLDAAVLQTEQIGRILTQDTIVEQDFVLKAGKWKNWTMDESGFGMQGFAEVYKVTRDEDHKRTGKEYLDGLINVLENPDGLWYRNWHRNQPDRTDDRWPAGKPVGVPVLMKDGETARGNGWAMIGLLAAHRMMPENGHYLDKAKTLAENMLNLQLEDGSWPFKLYESASEGGVSEKGTPLWSMLFYQLYEVTKDPRHLEAAQRALQWCMKKQYAGEDLLAAGGIVGTTWAAGLVYRNYFPLICSYTMDWFGLALLEQLKLKEK